MAADDSYGHQEQNPVRVGGGAMTVVAREQAYLNALRGPERQPIKYTRSGSSPGPDGTILDRYELTYAGLEKPIVLFIDAYRWADPAVPKGMTCIALFPLQPPPPDPFKTQDQYREIAAEFGRSRDLLPIPLDADGTATHGIALDHARIIARASRTAALEGRSLNLGALGLDVARQQTLVAAFPIRCDGRLVAPTGIDVVNPQQQAAPRQPGTLSTQALREVLREISVPESSIGARFFFAGFRQGEVVRITYDESCASREVLLPVLASPPRPLQQVQGVAMPAGVEVSEPTPTVRVQVILGMDGVPRAPEYVSGPFALAEAAKRAATEWRWDPSRTNGAPIQTTVAAAITFRK
jgi:hypothetical protein